MIIIGKFHSAQELKTINLLENWDRSKVKILIIDDEEFDYLEILRRNGYYIQHQKEITDIRHVSEYDIILCDIHGVGKELSPQHEGAFIIREIKKTYPTKVVIAYSAKTFDASYNEYFKIADFVFKKDLSSDQWIDKLDSAIKVAINPYYQWCQIKNYLIEQEIPTNLLMVIENNYVTSIIKNKNDFPNKTVSSMLNSNIKSVLLSVAGNLVFRLIFG